ncbi:MAG TPA: hypothetical protein P5234_15805 [Thermoanaerobaculaceae bacterium]|nr:hypothetical protein [Phycisphaerales bacterium]HRS17701.1 hypothetical protein [Thermoanaerobaculaceae bacterium]HRU10571.1 hypothetical protein [Thermoanaerobaculia bacterium]
MEKVLASNDHWITKRSEVMAALFKRATDTTDGEQLLYAAAFLEAIGDPKAARIRPPVKK